MELPPANKWKRIKTVLMEAMDRPPGERAAFLDTACDGDPQLRREVRALIDAEQEAPAFLNQDVVDFALPLLPDLPPDLTSDTVEGRSVGPYQLLRELGRGGMSTVFLAERTDTSFEQRVALKLLPPGLSSASLIRRFEQEQQIMASLHHPHIAKLLDGGVTDEGQPYLAMEHVEGRPIDLYCEENGLSVDERLALFVQVSQAVQHAHRNLVVHRDLKPSNVLITGEGVPKLLDFGIAKLMAEHEMPVATLQTRTGARWLTLPYAAPEQIRNESVTTATDGYQLGAILYEVMADRRPFIAQEDNPRALEDAILERPPEKPSTVADGPMKAILRGDLDRIILKALRKEPERRYPSVEALVDDVERYRNGQPVRARSGTWTYRAKKFVQRHRTGVATAAAIMLLVAGFIAMLMQQQAQTARQRDRAQAETAKAEQVLSFMVNLFETSNPLASSSSSITAQELLERGAEHVSQLSDHPEVQAQMLDAMGRAHLGLGHHDQADSLLRRALSIRRQLHSPPHSDLAASLGHMSHALRVMGEYAAAESLGRGAVSMQKALQRKAHPDKAESLHNLAFALKEQSKYAPAESLYREALSMRQNVRGGAHQDVAATMNNLGQLLTERGKYEAADSLHQEALAIRQKHWGLIHPKTAESFNNLAQVRERQGNLAEAESLYRKALAIDREALRPKHPNTLIDLGNLAVVVERQGRLAEAESLKRQSLALRQEVLGAGHPNVTASMNNLAVLLRKRNAYNEAASIFRRVLERNRKQFDDEHPYIAFTMGNLGDTRLEQGRLAAADSLYRATRDMLTSLFGEEHPHVATSLEDLADLREEQARLASAARFHRKAFAIRREALGKEHPKTAESLSGLADVLMKQNEIEAADSLYRKALDLHRKALPAGDWRTAEVRSDLGACLTEQKHHAAAESHLRSAAATLRKERDHGDRYVQTAYRRLADLYDAWNKPEQADAWRDSLDILPLSSS